MKSSENDGPIYVFETALISGGKIKIREQVVTQGVTITTVTVEMKHNSGPSDRSITDK